MAFSKGTSERIVALDFMRAFAVLMMVQGHTIDSLLDVSYRNSNSLIYDAWNFFRAFTAPLFIFVAGFVFTFLLYRNKISFKENPRIKKGIVRGVSLLLIGYLLRYPTINIFNLANVSYSHWITFFVVDALHLIGIGLLLIVGFSFIFSKINVKPIYSFILLALISFTISHGVKSIEWSFTKYLFLVNYLTSQFGSLFPVVPYLGYVFGGASFGLLFSENRDIFKNSFSQFILLTLGVISFSIPLLFETVYGTILFSVGMILVVFSISEFLSNGISKTPHIILSVSKNSLWIYIAHLIILYGSPTSIGLYQIVGKTQSALITLFVVIIMIILMITLSLGIDKLRITKFKNI